MRLDVFLVENNLAPSRTKAQEIIKKGLVFVENKQITKPSFVVNSSDVLIKQYKEYVSRSAWKLATFLQQIPLDVANKECLDIGSSTGGFTQVLLENNAKSVTCVDVGTNQLHPSIRENKKVCVYEQTDIRNFTHEPFEVVVSDVSFIALGKIIKNIDILAKKDIVVLFKPQFEVGLGVKRDKKGVVKDKKAIALAQSRFEDAAELIGWKLKAKETAHIKGKDGNLEYCYYFSK